MGLPAVEVKDVKEGHYITATVQCKAPSQSALAEAGELRRTRVRGKVKDVSRGLTPDRDILRIEAPTRKGLTLALRSQVESAWKSHE